MLISYKRGQTSVVLRVKIFDSSVTTGAGLTGLTSASSGLIIGTIADNESTSTAYTVAGSTIETISTLGTYATPTATKCRFKEVDSTNHKGIYEIQIADARFAVSSAKSLLVSISGATNAAQCDALVPLTDMDFYDAVHGGMSALPNTACTTNGSLLTAGTGTAQLSTSSGQVLLQTGTGTGQLDFTSGVVKSNVTQFGGSAGTFSGGRAEVNTTHIAGSAVSTSVAQIGVNVVNFGGSAGTFASGRPEVNMTHIRGTSSAGAVGYVGIDWGNITAPTTTVNLSGTTVKTATDVETDTQDIQSRIPTALSSGNMKCDVLAINTSTSAASTLAAFESGAIVSDTVATSPTSGGQFSGSNALSSTNDHYNGQKMAFTSGANAGLWRIISDYVGATREFQFNGGTGALDAPFPSTPTATDAFQIGGP